MANNRIMDLAIIKPNEMQLVPNAQDLEDIREQLQDMDRFPYGRIQIAAAGANVFKVTEPGDEDSTPVTEIIGVIVMSHKANGLWLGEFGKSDDKAPICSSMNGDEGINIETGELTKCDSCPNNQYGSANNGNGRGKACKNMRRLYIMRPGTAGQPSDIFPMILSLPPTALHPFDNYRTRVMMGHKKIYGVLTKITLKTQKSKDGVDYSTPVFEAMAALPPAEAERVRQYAKQFSDAAQNAGLSSDDYATSDTDHMTSGGGTGPAADRFVDVSDEELPFEQL